MAIERLTLPEDQWFEYIDRPVHGVVRKIARDTQRAQKSQDPLEAEDQLVLNLGKAWEVRDEDGQVLPFVRASFDKVPQDIWSVIVDACTTVLENAIPNP